MTLDLFPPTIRRYWQADGRCPRCAEQVFTDRIRRWCVEYLRCGFDESVLNEERVATAHLEPATNPDKGGQNQ